MNWNLFRKDILPLALMLGALLTATVVLDVMLHALGAAWVGRYVGIPGVVLILISLGYSLRKHKRITWGSPRTWLKMHESLAWVGSLLVLVHAGIHFNALLPWLATLAMLINVISGLTGKFLLARSGRHLASRRAALEEQGVAADVIDARVFWDEVTLDMMRQWRVIHFPIALAFAALALAHIVSILIMWGWH